MSPKKDNQEEPTEAEVVNDKKNDRVNLPKKDNRFYFGLILILIGALFIAENLYPGIDIWGNFWPIILIVFGFSLIAKGAKE